MTEIFVDDTADAAGLGQTVAAHLVEFSQAAKRAMATEARAGRQGNPQATLGQSVLAFAEMAEKFDSGLLPEWGSNIDVLYGIYSELPGSVTVAPLLVRKLPVRSGIVDYLAVSFTRESRDEPAKGALIEHRVIPVDEGIGRVSDTYYLTIPMDAARGHRRVDVVHKRDFADRNLVGEVAEYARFRLAHPELYGDPKRPETAREFLLGAFTLIAEELNQTIGR